MVLKLRTVKVSLNRISRLVYSLPLDQLAEIKRLVKLAKAVEQGDIAISSIGEDVKEVVLIDEPPVKKPRVQNIASGKTRNKVEPKRKRVTKKETDLELHPREDIIIQEKDPLFETGNPVPCVSKIANSRLVFRAIYLKNNKLLTKLLKDGSKIYKLYTKSVDNMETPIEAAARVKSTEILETILQEYFGSKFKDRKLCNRDDPCRIDKLGTGRYNQRSLGIKFIRKITSSRGSREGNNSLTENETETNESSSKVIKLLLNAGLDDAQWTVIENFMAKSNKNIYENILSQHDVCELLLAGHHQTAGRIIEHSLKKFWTKFNSLYKDVLLQETGDLANCSPSACKHINKQVSGITPYHCAAASPYSQHLAKLLHVQPDVHVADSKGRRPMHYAAGCVSPDSLKLLLQWGANTSDTDNTRRIPLHYAIYANRPLNVKLLLEHAKQGGAKDIFAQKYGTGGVNRQTSNSMTPLHTAAKNGFLEIAELLIKHGADVNAKLGVSQNQISPLMLAAAGGHLDMIYLLVKFGAVVEQKDRMGRTAVIYASKNGSTSVLTYLMHLGASVNRADNSGNTPMHYAAAYGWLFTLRALLDAGADLNAHNMWRTTPLSVAYLKSHYGIVQELLAHGKVDINFTDDDGMSLLFHACSSDLSQADLCEQITYMVEEKGASCRLLDNMGRSPLHHLTKAIATVDADEDRDKQEEQMKYAYAQSVDIARLLLKNGCTLNAVDENGLTATMAAIGQVNNLPLVKFLLSQGGKIEAPLVVTDGPPLFTMMHRMASNMWKAPANLSSLMKLLKDGKCRDQVVKMCDQVDCNGFTPLLQACLVAREGAVKINPPPKSNPWTQVRQFIKNLVIDFKANLNAKVSKKHFNLDDMPSPNSPYWWHRKDSAEKSPVHIVLFGNDPEYNTDLTEVISSHGGHMFRELVSLGADLNVYDLEGMTPLGSCISNQRQDLLHFLRMNSKCDFNMPIKESKNEKHEEIAPLLFISRISKQGNSGMINELIDCGSDIDAKVSGTDMKCLHLLVVNANEQSREDVLKVVDKLSKIGYDFNSKDSKGRTALHYAVRANAGNMSAGMELEVKLLQLGASPGLQDSKGRSALHYVFKSKTQKRHSWGNLSSTEPAELSQLISKNMNKLQINQPDKYGRTALHYAALKGASICCMYLAMIGANPNMKDNDGNTALALAVQGQFDGCASNLIQGGASLKSMVTTISAKELQKRKMQKKCDNNAQDLPVEPWTCYPPSLVKEEEAIREVQLYQAAVENNLNGVAMFITGADKSISGLTQVDAIQITFKTCMYQTSLRLLHTNTDRTVLRKKLSCDRSFLHMLSLSCEKSQTKCEPTLLKLGEWLVNAGLRPDAFDKFGCTPVQYAILNRQFALADLLTGKAGGYDVDYKDGMGRSHLAAVLWRTYTRGIGDANTWSFVKKLIEKKIDLDQHFDLPLNPDLVNITVQGTKLDPVYYNRYRKTTTALITAIGSNQFVLAKNLLKSGANPNAVDGAGLSPLMHAIKMNQVNFVKLLLHYEFDPNKKEESQSKRAMKVKKWNKERGAFRLKAHTSISYGSDDSEEESNDEEYERQTQTKNHDKETAKPEWSLVKKTSPLNLDQTDCDGRTALHYVACPSLQGTFDNGEMAFLLIQNGATLNHSKAGLTAYQEAVQAKAATVARLLQTKFVVPVVNLKASIFLPLSSTIEDDVPPIVGTWPDVSKAAHQVLRRYTSDMDQTTPTYVHTVDPNCHVKNGQLVRDEDMGRYFDVLMTRVDVKRGDWGLYNFYQIQLVFQPSKKLYILFTQWGRIEDDGQFQHTPFTDREEAVKEFAKVFREKSGNKWADINRYEQKPGKYRLVEDIARQAPPALKDVDIDLSSNVASMLPKHLQNVINILMDPEAIQFSMKNIRGLDTKSLPFGQLNEERLLQGQKLLQQIELLVDEIDKYKEKSKKEDPSTEEKDAHKKNLEKVADLSNDYYHVIPQSNFSCKKLHPLDDRHRLQSQIYNLSNLLHYQVACRFVLAAMWHRHEYNPIDFVYHSMGCKMQLMDRNEDMVQVILKYIWLSKNATQDVHAIYKLEREGEKKRTEMFKHQSERRLLFHGSSTCNLLSILHHGLVVSPPNAESSGSLYGKGIYFSDAFSFSANYTRSSKVKFMLLCEVTMGNVMDYVQKMNETKNCLHSPADAALILEDKTADTVMVRGNYYISPVDWFILPSGEQLPQGAMRRDTSYFGSSNTQYIVRDPAKVRLRYLIQFS
ncbi:poly [ADP-ribose] polymerase [Plakobranchus ocellatus]|uniref:Poly [ADP-ribose] polymerase n=1 Tax=Plakobranchus ocellatus TaxID=259542 RepID=A0AAV4BEC0_9GAST|nr:poly [ADP-ribose] polymerase [Plakobranchus ocellatus]